MKARHVRATAATGALFATLLASPPGVAKCPNEKPDDPACEPISSMMMPSVEGTMYFPKGDLGPYYGGGVDFVLFSWSNNNDAFGPSQGSLRMGASYLAGKSDRHLLLYRFASVVSLEGNASRRFFIPYFGGALGALWETDLGNRALADAALGLYFVYTRNFVLDAQGGVVIPFTAVDTLLGPKAQLTASFALW